METFDVLVVGFGPVGAVLAARLGSWGVSTLVVERDRAPFPLPRAVAADDEVRLLLRATAPAALEGMLSGVGVRFVTGGGRRLGAVAFPPGVGGEPGLSLFHQPSLERAVREVVAGEPAVQVRLGVALASFSQDAAGVTARLADGTAVRARWLVGCDGASSLVRRLAGIAWLGRDLPHEWLVADLSGEVASRRGFTYTCDPAQPRVDMPVPGGHRVEWLLRPGSAAQDGPLPPLLRAHLGPEADGLEVVRAVRYRFGARRAGAWQAGRVLLAGDAAHTMPPFAGQGLGAGVRDAWSLAWRLAAGDPSGYPAERAGHVRAMTRLSLLVGAILQTGSPTLAAGRDRALSAAFAAPGLGGWLSRGGPRRTSSGVWESSLSGPSTSR